LILYTKVHKEIDRQTETDRQSNQL